MGATGSNIVAASEKRTKGRSWQEMLPWALFFIGFEDAREPMCDGDAWV